MNDFINGSFELMAGTLLLVNCWKLHKDKRVRGVSIFVTAFFGLWGFWNLYYYPSLNQTASFIGGIMVVFANTLWVGMAVYYERIARAIAELGEK